MTLIMSMLLLFSVSIDGLAASSMEDSFIKNEENSKLKILEETDDIMQAGQKSLEEEDNKDNKLDASEKTQEDGESIQSDLESSEEENNEPGTLEEMQNNDLIQSKTESTQKLEETVESDTISSVSDEAKSIQTITKFKQLQDSCLNYEEKPNLSDVITDMPKTIEVYLNNQDTTTSIPVTWETEQEYNATQESYYLFWAKWDENCYVLDKNYNLQDYLPFIEVVIEMENKDTIAVSGIDNIISRAYHQVNITWIPAKLVDGFRDSKGILTGTYFPGRIYVGLPYGQMVNSGRYVPHSVSFGTFLEAVADSNSLFYTSRGGYGALESTYYGNDCSAFVAYAYGLPRMTTTTIGISSQFSKVDGNSIYNAQVGDCFNKSGSHVELITGMEYDQNGELVSVEVSEQTPPKARTVIYTPSEVQKIINGGYVLLRYKQREYVKEPDHYNGCMDVNSFFDTEVNMGTDFYAYIINTAAWLHATNDNGDVRAYSETGESNQIWYFELQDDGSYKITSCEDGKCMEASDAQSGDGINVKVSDWMGSFSQRWFLYGIEGKYKLRAASGAEVLDLSGASVADGTNLDMWEYKGANAQLFQISKVDKIGNIKNAEISLERSEYTYSQVEKKPAVTVKYGSKTLKLNTDYNLYYKDNINAGIATVTIKGIGNYTGTTTKSFIINKANPKLDVSVLSTNMVFGKIMNISASASTPITYQSDNAEIAQVDEDGVITGVGIGKVSIMVVVNETENYNGDKKVIDINVVEECSADRHDYNSKVTKQATCTEEGNYTYICSVCGNIYTEPIEATGHKETIDAAVEPTCIEEGKTEGSHCSVCNLTLKEQTSIPKTNHTYKDVIQKATLTTSGKIANTCSECGKVQKTSKIYYPKTIILSTTSYVYTGKAKKPSVTIKDSKGQVISSSNYQVIYPAGRTNVGTYSLTIKFKGDKYTGTTKKTFKISPKSMNLSSVKSNARGKLTASWSKNTTVTGYEIKYGVKSSFSGAKITTVSSYKTTSKTISNLTRGKKYYVKMRCYKTVNGVKYYSKWGSTKTVTIKR